MREASLAVAPGRIVTLLGANGAGKSSVLNAVMGLAPASGGSVIFAGERLDGLAPERIVRRGLTLTPEGRRVFAGLSVGENLAIGAASRRGGAEVRRTREQMFELFPVLAERLEQPAGTLSGGEQQMLAIARSLMCAPRMLLLDEPSLGLAPQVVDAIFALIARLRDDGLTILLVEQNVELALEIADEGFVLAGGQVVMSGPAADLRRSGGIAEAYLGAA